MTAGYAVPGSLRLWKKLYLPPMRTVSGRLLVSTSSSAMNARCPPSRTVMPLQATTLTTPMKSRGKNGSLFDASWVLTSGWKKPWGAVFDMGFPGGSRGGSYERMWMMPAIMLRTPTAARVRMRTAPAPFASSVADMFGFPWRGVEEAREGQRAHLGAGEVKGAGRAAAGSGA